MDKQKICNVCGTELDEVHEHNRVGGEILCDDCLERETMLCQDCGVRIWNSDNMGTDRHPLCRQCYDDCYTHCIRCGCLINNDAACYVGDYDGPYCSDCCPDDEAIHDYRYKPRPIFYGEGKRYFGVELKVDDGGEDDTNAQDAMDIANIRCREHIYCKHDGSLDNGFEMVTHPMTLQYHEKEMPWKDLVDAVRRMGYRSHQAATCGLHIHVNRNAFGETQSEQDEVIARILYFFEKFWDELLKFSRRTKGQLESWARRYGYKEHPQDILHDAKRQGKERYNHINLTNTDTVEFRMFRGTLKYNTIIATLQFVNQVCDMAICLSDDEVKEMSWTTFVSWCTEPELVQYLKERRLYINEPVKGEEAEV